MVEATYLHSENKGCGMCCMPFIPRNEGPRESIKSLLSLLTSFSRERGKKLVRARVITAGREREFFKMEQYYRGLYIRERYSLMCADANLRMKIDANVIFA